MQLSAFACLHSPSCGARTIRCRELSSDVATAAFKLSLLVTYVMMIQKHVPKTGFVEQVCENGHAECVDSVKTVPG